MKERNMERARKGLTVPSVPVRPACPFASSSGSGLDDACNACACLQASLQLFASIRRNSVQTARMKTLR